MAKTESGFCGTTLLIALFAIVVVRGIRWEAAHCSPFFRCNLTNKFCSLRSKTSCWLFQVNMTLKIKKIWRHLHYHWHHSPIKIWFRLKEQKSWFFNKIRLCESLKPETKTSMKEVRLVNQEKLAFRTANGNSSTNFWRVWPIRLQMQQGIMIHLEKLPK